MCIFVYLCTLKEIGDLLTHLNVCSYACVCMSICVCVYFGVFIYFCAFVRKGDVVTFFKIHQKFFSQIFPSSVSRADFVVPLEILLNICGLL